MAQSAYARSAAPVRTDRGNEYDAFAHVTGKLKSVTASEAKNFPALASALHDNRKLWTLMATSVADKDNQLPKELRADIFSLAEFSMQHGDKVLDGKATPDILVEINTMMMRGLKAGGHA